MTESVINWKEEWNQKEDGDKEKYLRITDILNMTVTISDAKIDNGTSKKDNSSYEYVIMTTDKGKVKTSSKPIVKAVKSKVLPVINAGGAIRVTVKSKPTGNGVYYYFVPPQ